MKDLKEAWKYSNLQKAWEWIKSNPDRAYKSYFREIYSGYAVAEEQLLKHLENKLNRQIYSPQNSVKIFTPKPSGILRPYSLLSIEDQIVYQSMANLVAEKIYAKTRKRYLSQIFGHLYAGQNSIWFYKKWSDGYKAFNEASIAAFNEGRVWSATFDLTAFYDSIDHNVLSQILQQYSLSIEFCTNLNNFLTTWTATNTRIYHNHGIPQGPLSSGIISEAVLSHIDKNFSPLGDVKYLRYVDDIKLFSKSELELRHALVQLDRLSKDIGLFPQSGKINIHKITDINEELKFISNPYDIFLDEKEIQSNAQEELKELAPAINGYKINNLSRFKYLISIAKPTLRVLNRALSVLEYSPEYHTQVSQYIKKFKKIPKSQALKIMSLIKANSLYPTVQASLIDACSVNMANDYATALKKLLKPMWYPRTNTVDLSIKLWACLNRLNHLTAAQKNYYLMCNHLGWFKAQMLQEATPNEPDLNKVTDLLIKDLSNDVALSAAWLAIKNNLDITVKSRDINPVAKIVLQNAGKIKKSSVRLCGIKSSMLEISGISTNINWKKLFGEHYKNAESKLVAAKGYFKTNPTAFVNSMDTFNDLLLHCISLKDQSVGSKTLGDFNIQKTSRFSKKYPRTYAFAESIHEKRLDSELSHAVNRKKNKKPTKRISFKWLPTGKKLLKSCLTELNNNY